MDQHWILTVSCSFLCVCDSQQPGPYCQGSNQQNHFEKIRILFSISDCSRSADSGIHCLKMNWSSRARLTLCRRYLDF
jgi:hypothetical protein